jgi:hypothetical protein
MVMALRRSGGQAGTTSCYWPALIAAASFSTTVPAKKSGLSEL